MEIDEIISTTYNEKACRLLVEGKVAEFNALRAEVTPRGRITCGSRCCLAPGSLALICAEQISGTLTSVVPTSGAVV